MTIREGRKRGNPNWGKPSGDANVAGNVERPQFELIVSELGLQPEQYPRSRKLKAWVLDHYHQRYVPEALLRAWDLHPRTENFG